MKVQVITAPITNQIQKFQKSGYLRPDELINVVEKNVTPAIMAPKVETAGQYFSPTTLIKSVHENGNKQGETICFLF